MGRLLQQITAGGDVHKPSVCQESANQDSANPVIDLSERIDVLLRKLEDPARAVWAPSYAAAALQHTTPNPCSQSAIRVLGLDQWESYQHRYASTCTLLRLPGILSNTCWRSTTNTVRSLALSAAVPRMFKLFLLHMQ